MAINLRLGVRAHSLVVKVELWIDISDYLGRER